MTSYKVDCESVKSLVPLYVKGLLSDSERTEFERALVDCPYLKEEVERWERIDGAYRAVEGKLPQPSGRLYSKITERIRETRRVGLLERLMPSPRFSLALIAAQLLIIITLGIYVINLKIEYRTLTSEYISQGEGIRINVVFDKESREKEIREILNSIGASIISGPSPEGLYIIELKDKRDMEAVLKTLRNSRIVRFAERAY